MRYQDGYFRKNRHHKSDENDMIISSMTNVYNQVNARLAEPRPSQVSIRLFSVTSDMNDKILHSLHKYVTLSIRADCMKNQLTQFLLFLLSTASNRFTKRIYKQRISSVTKEAKQIFVRRWDVSLKSKVNITHSSNM